MWQIFSFFFVGAKLGKTIAYVAVVTALTSALILTFTTLLGPISRTIPPDAVIFASAILPANLNACVSVVISARIARWIYDRNLKIADKLSE